MGLLPCVSKNQTPNPPCYSRTMIRNNLKRDQKQHPKNTSACLTQMRDTSERNLFACEIGFSPDLAECDVYVCIFLAIGTSYRVKYVSLPKALLSYGTNTLRNRNSFVNNLMIITFSKKKRRKGTKTLTSYAAP